MAAMKKGPVVEAFWKIHPWLYRVSGGRILGHLTGMDVLLLTTTGAKSGVERTTALTYFRPSGPSGSPAADAPFVVIGSFLGEPRHPGWVHNLRKHPEATLLVGSRKLKARAHEAQGEARERLWAELIQIQPDYRAYENHTERVIPVVVLQES